jgi:hypothetical protein
MEVQLVTNDDEYIYLDSIREAFGLYQPKNVKKISWCKDSTKFRFRPKTKANRHEWCKASEDKLCELSESYKNETDEGVWFWVNQSVCSPNLKELFDLHGLDLLDSKEDILMASCILDVLTEDEFKRKFC